MTLPASGQISLSQVNTELGYSSTASITMNDSAVRSLFGVSSGAISMSNGWGKANAWSGTITSSQSNFNLRTWATSAGWNGTTKAIITVNAGVYIWSSATGTPGMTIDGSWPGGCFLVNNGYIMGCGGGGGTGAGSPGNAAGPAISLGVSCTITNNSYIAGGGGGGAARRYDAHLSGPGGGGGGAGGGAGAGATDGWTSPKSVGGGAGGGIGSSGGNGGSAHFAYTGSSGHAGTAGGGGGRILPGSGGGGGSIGVVAQGGGAGGGAGAGASQHSNPGGTGGSAGSAGGNGSGHGGGGGGGWGASGGQNTAGSHGGAGGKAVALNGYSVTWPATGTRYGAIS